MKRLIAMILMLALTLSLGCTAFADNWICMDCGTENSGKFCGKCGLDMASSEAKRVTAEAEQRIAEMQKLPAVQRNSVIDLSRSENWFCLTCGIELTTNFCTNCGQKRGEGLTGGLVTFGAYEQDNDLQNGAEPIEWLVLAEESDRILVISRYGLDEQPYHSEKVDITWETCTLRSWLNGEFLNAAFNAEEQAMIPKLKVTADKNPKYDTNPGKDTQDKVFLLSIKEAKRYYGDDAARRCYPTDYAIANGAWVVTEQDAKDYSWVSASADDIGACWWWLRSPGSSSDCAASVYSDGSVIRSGGDVRNTDVCVRPAMWITF